MKPIYLDYQATTPADPWVLAAMESYWSKEFGNPHSEGHEFGWNARRAVERARSQVADLINADDDEVIFVSGATESCNLALRGLAVSEPPGRRRQIITLATEHPAVLQTARALGDQGRIVDVLPVEPDGLLDLEKLSSALSDQTLLVSCMLANNEIGVIQPLEHTSTLCRSAGAFVHTDATQAAGRIKLDVDQLGVDLLSLSGHKIYGPNGVGILYIRNRPDLTLEPIMTGGSQERSIRPGTVPVPLVVGMGEACAIAKARLEDDAVRIADLAQRLLNELTEEFPQMLTFGTMQARIPGNVSIGVPGIPGELLVEAVSREVAISTGAACSTGSPEPSHVLVALGYEPELAATGVRISLGRFTTDEEIGTASRSIVRAIKTLTGGT